MSHLWPLLALLLSCLFASTVNAQWSDTGIFNDPKIPGVKVITLGLSVTLSPPGAGRTAQGRSLIAGHEYWFRWARRQPPLVLKEGNFTFALKYLDDQNNGSLVTQNYETLCNDPSIDYLLGPVNSDFSILARTVTTKYRRVIITEAANPLVWTGQFGVFTVDAPSAPRALSPLRVFSIKGAKTIATIIEPQLNQLAICNAARDNAISFGMKYVGSINVSDSSVKVDVANVSAAVSFIKTLNPDLLAICAFTSQQTKAIIQACKDQNYLPKGIFYAGNSEAEFDDPLYNYAAGVIEFWRGVKVSKDLEFGSGAKVAEEMTEIYGPDSHQAHIFEAAVSPHVYWKAMQVAGTKNQEDVLKAIQRTHLDLWYGKVSFDQDGGNVGKGESVPVIQPIGNVKYVVAPFDEADQDLVYPMPSWEERVYKQSRYDESSEVAITVVTTIIGVVFLILMVITVVMRERPIFRTASPPFLLTTLFGGVMTICANYTWMVYVDTPSCRATPWLLSTGFTFMFGSLFCKSWRIYKIFARENLQVLAISDAKLGIFLVILILLQCIPLIIWSAAYPLEAVVRVVDVYRPSKNYVICEWGDKANAFVGSLLGFALLMLLIGSIILFQIQKVKSKFFNESRHIGFAVYNLFFFSALIVILHYAASSIDRNVLFIVRAILILIATTLSIGCVFLPKLRNLNATKEMVQDSLTSRSGTVTNKGTSRGNNTTQASDDLMEENRRLKARIAELEAKYGK